MKKCMLVLAAIAAVQLGSAADAALIAYWNFNGLAITTAAPPGSPGVPTSIAADQGAGTLDLTGYFGNVDDFAGSTINVLGADAAEESLSLVAGGTAAPFPGNGGYIEAEISTVGLVDPIVTFSTRGTGTGFNSGLWSYSTDGLTFTPVGGNTASTSTTFALATLDLTGIVAVANQPSLTLRYTVSGATSSSGNNRIDNLQINATAVPEPATLALGGLALIGVVATRRRG